MNNGCLLLVGQGWKHRLVVVLWVLLSLSPPASDGAPKVSLQAIGRPLQVSTRRSSPHVEPCLAVDPTNPDHLAVAAMFFSHDKANPKVAIYESTDGGILWRDVDIKSASGADPWVAFTANGDLFVAHLPDSVHRRRRGATSFDEVLSVPGKQGAYDFCKIVAVENSLHWVASLSQRDGKNRAVASVAVSTWTETSKFSEPVELLERPIEYQIGSPAIGPKGALFVPYYELSDSRELLKKHPIRVARLKNNGTFVASTPFGDGECLGLAVLGASDGGDVTLVVPWMKLGSANVWVSKSIDSGRSWLEPKAWPVPFSWDTPARFGVASDGVSRVLLTWVGPATANQTGSFGAFAIASTDGGRTFSEPLDLSGGTYVSETEANSITVQDTGRAVSERYWFGGDYIGAACLPDGKFVAVWSDARKGVFQLWSRRFQITTDTAAKRTLPSNDR